MWKGGREEKKIRVVLREKKKKTPMAIDEKWIRNQIFQPVPLAGDADF